MKLIVLSLTLLVIPSVIIGVSSYQTAKSSLDSLGSEGLKNNVLMAEQMITLLNAEVEAGHLTLKEAQEMAREQLIGAKEKDNTRSIDSPVDMGEHGYFFVLDEEGIAVAHPVLEGEDLYDSQTPSGMYSTREILKVAEQGGGFIEFEFAIPGEETIAPKITYAKQEPNWGWIITAGSYLKDFNSEATGLLNRMLWVVGIALALGAIVTFIFSNQLSRKIRNVTNRMGEVAKGDLRIEPFTVESKDEVGELQHHFNLMIEQLKQMIREVLEASHHVAATSEQLSASSDETAKLVQQVAESVQEVALGADDQVRKATGANDLATRVTEDMADVVNNVTKVNESSKETAQKAQIGNVVVRETIDHMHTVQNETAYITEMINDLGRKSSEIGKIVSLITNVSEQTNLLALNASIEAARAGEHGQGFAVVAEEVRKLAEESADASQQIGHLIEDVQEDISRSVDAMNKGQQSVDGGLELVDEAGNTFQDIMQSIEDVSNQVIEVSTAVDNMSSIIEDMTVEMDETKVIAEDSASHTDEIAAAAEEQSASVQEITSVSEMLSQMAVELRESVSIFRI